MPRKKKTWTYRTFGNWGNRDEYRIMGNENLQYKTRRQYIYTIEDVIAFNDEYIDAEIYIEESYGDSHIELAGWLPATEEETAKYNKYIEKEKEEEAIHRQQRIDAARELLRKEGEL